MDISKIVFHEKFKLDVPDGELSDEGQAEIMTLLDGNTPISVKQFREALPDDWSWEWKVAHGTYAGTLSKRIQSLVFKKFDIKLPESIVTNLGNLANQHTLTGRSFIFDFDNTLEWEAGDFGDDGSCFWTDKSYILPTLQHFGGLALRLWHQAANGQYTGVGRALLLPYVAKQQSGYHPEEWAKPDALLVFNGYGKDMANYGKSSISSQRYGKMQVLDYARLLALFLGVSYQRVRMRVNASYSSPLYINNDGNAVVVGPADVIKPWAPTGALGAKRYTFLDTTWDPAEQKKFITECSNCGRTCMEKPVGHARQLRRAPNGDVLCQMCYDQLFVPCYGGCGKTLYIKEDGLSVIARRLDDAGATPKGNDRVYICSDCQPKFTFVCSLCHNRCHVSERQDYYLPRRGQAARRVYVCSNCDTRFIHTALCPGCTRRYPLKHLLVTRDKQPHFGTCSYCRQRAKKKAALEKDEEVGAELLLPLEDWQPVSEEELRQAVTAALVEQRAFPHRPIPQPGALSEELGKRLAYYANYIHIHTWRPTAGRPYFQMSLDKADWSENTDAILDRLQFELDQRDDFNPLVPTKLIVRENGPITVIFNIYFQLNVDEVGIHPLSLTCVLDSLRRETLLGAQPEPGDSLGLSDEYLQTSDSPQKLQTVIETASRMLKLDWPPVQSVRSDFENTRQVVIQF